MKRAISALNCQIDEIIAPLFYKCRMFCIHDSELGRANYYENPYFKKSEGYEEDLVDWIVTHDVEEAYSMRFRPEVRALLEAANIKVVELPDQDRSVEEVIESFES